MRVVDVYQIKPIPEEVAPEDFKRFIQDKFEYRDPMGEHLFSLQSIYLGCRYLFPPGDILDFFLEIKETLEREACDYFTLIKWKHLLNLSYMKEELIRLLVLNKDGFSRAFWEYIEDKYEYKDPLGEHIYSLESIWLGAEAFPEEVKQEYFGIWKLLRAHSCSLFTIIED